MSLRPETSISPQLQDALSIPTSIMDRFAHAPPVGTARDENIKLSSANSFHTSTQDNPITRTISFNIEATLNELMLKESKASWKPASQEANRSIW